jgi:pyruvate formate lyase activating enzyme
MREYKEERETIFWKRDRKGIKCKICCFECNIPEGKVGICKVRQNKRNELIIKDYGSVEGLEVNRIEERNLYNFLPQTFTLAIKMKSPKEFQILPDVKRINRKFKPIELVSYAKEKKVKSIIFTGSEFVGHYEYVVKVFREARKNNIRTILTTTGLINEEPIKKISKYTDALVVYFFASGNKDYYKRNSLIGKIERLYEVVKMFAKYRVFIEVVNILVRGYENVEECKNLANWVVSTLGAEIPLHILKGDIKLSLVQLKEYYTACKDAGLRYVYIDNSKDILMESSHCHNCGSLLVERSGCKVKLINLVNDRCPNCGIKHNFVFE